MKHDTMRLTFHEKDQVIPLTLPLSSQSCWARFFGPWPLPCEGAIDQIHDTLSHLSPDRVTLHACPSACLLPALWLRTIWLTGSHTPIEIQWDHVTDPCNDRARQAAGRLACLLVDRVRCAAPDDARSLWGIEESGSADNNDNVGEAFDLLTNIIDLWDTDLRHTTTASDWSEAVRRAILGCAAVGHRRVAIYGAGTHTRAIGDALMEPAVEIKCIIDDDARRHTDHLWGYPIVSREHALTLDLDAVVISANSIEDHLWERAAVFRDAGTQTLRLYSGDD